MKYFLLLFLPSICLAAGPKYSYEDNPKLDDEIRNIYHDIRNVANGTYKASSMTLLGITATSGTITTLTATTINGSAYTAIVAGQLPATATNDNAAAGKVGEAVQSNVGATNFASSGNFGTITSILLTPGDWDVGGAMLGDRGTATQTQFTLYQLQIVTNPAGVGQDGYTRVYFSEGATGINSVNLAIPNFRISLSANATAYLQGAATYSAGQPQGYGGITARRIR